MMISSIRNYNTYTLNQRKTSHLKMSEELSAVISPEQLVHEIREVLTGEGKVYGVFRKRQLVGCVLLDRVRDYFPEEKTQTFVCGERTLKLTDFHFGENRDIYRFRQRYCAEEMNGILEELGKELWRDLSDRVRAYEEVAAVIWGDRMICRNRINPRSRKSLMGFGIGAGTGFVLGMLLGRMGMGNVSIGLCFGVGLSLLFGNVGTLISESSEICVIDLRSGKEEEAAEEQTEPDPDATEETETVSAKEESAEENASEEQAEPETEFREADRDETAQTESEETESTEEAPVESLQE